MIDNHQYKISSTSLDDP